MSMNLVGTMSSLGATEAEILAVATAMSSLGITAERGGSSISKFFVDMASSVNEGGDALTGFTKITGMTEEAFTDLFNTDPTQAFKAFIDGLAEIDQKGGSVVQALDDFGIKEIRLRDTLLRLAQGHQVLGSALDESNSAFQEGTALMTEYELMASSTSNQWAIAKNQFRDVAISIGQELLPVILDLLGQSDGIVDMAKGFAEWFGNLDDGTKEFIVKAGVLTPILGTMLSTGGKLLVGGANIIGIIGKIAKGLGILEGAFKLLGMTDIAGNAITLGTAFSGLINPVTLAGLAIAGVGTAVYLATDDMRKMYDRMNEFPDITDITEEQAESLRAMKDDVNNLNVELGNLNENTDLGDVQESLSSLGDEIQDLNDERIASLRKSFEELPPAVQQALESSLNATIQKIEDSSSRVEQINNRLSQIMEKTVENSGVIPERYLQEVQGLTQEMFGIYSMSLGETVEQANEIYSVLTMKHKDMNENQLLDRRNYLIQAKELEEQNYAEQEQALREHLKEGNYTVQEANEAMLKFEQSKASAMLAINTDMIQTGKEMWERYGKEQGQTYDEMIDELVEKTKMSREQVEAIWNSEPMYFGDMEQGALEAVNKMNQIFNDMEIDPAQLNTENIDEFIKKAQEAGLTWEQLELLSKDANVDSNVRAFLTEVLNARSEWDLLTFEEKQAKIQTEGKEEFEKLLKDLGVTWEEIEPRVKELTVDGRPAMDALWIALSETDNWNNLTVDQKMLLVENSIANENLRVALSGLEEWQKIELIEKFAQIRTNAPETQVEFTNLLVEWGLIPTADTKVFSTETNAEGTQETIGTLASYWLLSLIGSFLPSVSFETETNAEDTQGEVSALSEEMTVTRANMGEGAKATMTTNSPETVTALGGVGRTMNNTRDNMSRGASAKLSATDNATWVMRNVLDQLRNLNGRTATTYIDTVHRTFGRRAYSGTNRHVGGALVLGDGGRREPFLTPDGRFGVSPATDTVYDLPYGTKVWNSVNRFKQEASDSPLLANFIKQLPHFATGTKQSFLDELQTIKLPVRLDDFGKTSSPTVSGDTLVFNIDLSVVGNSLSPQQADKIIEPLIKSAERYTNKRRTKVTIGGG